MSAGKASQRLSNEQFKDLLTTYSRTKKVIDTATADLKELLTEKKKTLTTVSKTISSHLVAENIDDAIRLPESGGTLQMITREATPKLSAPVTAAIESAMDGYVAPDNQVDFLAAIREKLAGGATQKSSLKHVK